MTDDEIRAECERLFQAGGTRTQMLDASGRFERMPMHSVPYALRHRLNSVGDRIFARRKQRDGKYKWVEIKAVS